MTLKKISLILVCFLMAETVFTQQRTISLDQALQDVAQILDQRLTDNVNVAVLNFNSPSERLTNYVILELERHIINGGKLTVVDRKNLSIIQQEINFQMSGDVSDESAQSIGKMLGAHTIISGTIEDIGSYYLVRFRAIEVETAAIRVQTTANVIKDSFIASLLQKEGFGLTWKDKWLYVGGSVGIGGFFTSLKYPRNIIYNSSTNVSYQQAVGEFYSSDISFVPMLQIEVWPLSWLAFEIGLQYYNPIIYYGDDPKYVLYSYISDTSGIQISTVVKAGYRSFSWEITGDIGYSIFEGFAIGATFGRNLGPGVLFATARFTITPEFSEPGANIYALLPEIGTTTPIYNYRVLLGYKLGLINKKPNK